MPWRSQRISGLNSRMSFPLPVEIIIPIIEANYAPSIPIDPHSDAVVSDPVNHYQSVTTLRSLCLTSKLLQDLALPLLYQEFSLGYRDKRGDCCPSSERRLGPFVRTITARPDLAAMVRRVFIHPRLLDCMDDEEVLDAIWHIDRTLGAPTLHPSIDFLFGQRQHIYNEDHLQLRVYSLLLNVERVVVHFHSGKVCAPTWLTSFLTMSRFRHLEHVEVVRSFLHLTSTASMCAIPLKRLTVHGGHLSRGASQVIELVHLRIFNVRLTKSDIDGIMGPKGFSDLQSFEYEAAPPGAFVMGRDYHFYPQDVISALSKNAHTLRHISIKMNNVGDEYTSREVIGPRVTTLRHFNILETLLLSANMFAITFGVASQHPNVLANMLPASLESLDIVSYIHETVFKALAMATGEGNFPNLRRVGYSGHYMDVDEDMLRPVFNEVVVSFSVVDYKLSGPVVYSRRLKKGTVPFDLHDDD